MAESTVAHSRPICLPSVDAETAVADAYVAIRDLGRLVEEGNLDCLRATQIEVLRGLAPALDTILRTATRIQPEATA